MKDFFNTVLGFVMIVLTTWLWFKGAKLVQSIAFFNVKDTPIPVVMVGMILVGILVAVALTLVLCGCCALGEATSTKVARRAGEIKSKINLARIERQDKARRAVAQDGQVSMTNAAIGQVSIPEDND